MRIIVSISREGELGVQDLELDATLLVHELASLLPPLLRWAHDVPYEVSAYPPGRTLLPYESLAEAGVWDGGWLVFHPVRTGAALASSRST